MDRFRTRSAGILLHPTSLPGRFGIGDLGPGVDVFLDWARDAGQTLWQVLPLTPTGPGGSPYGSHSAFAGNAMLISPDLLVQDGFLALADIEGCRHFPEGRVDLGPVTEVKQGLLRRSWSYFRNFASPQSRYALEAFTFGEDQKFWLDDWALYMALKNRFEGTEWLRWDASLSRREPEALLTAKRELQEEIAFHKYVQFLFFRQWGRVRTEAGKRGIGIIGDVPIYVALDSVDVWANRDLFMLDESGHPLAVAGVPPDYFSKTGQRWGNPLYRWDRLAEKDYAWWASRLRANFRLADIVRLDHFRGFAKFWEVPASEPTAVNGRWVDGPGIDFFHALRRALGDVPLIAEDLGEITSDVEALREESALPGMRVLQFAFGQDKENPHLPSNHTERSIVYTGTHDNDTSVGWYEKAGAVERSQVDTWLGVDPQLPVEWRMIKAAYESPAVIAIVPMQDVLGLDSEARMNVPGEGADNWAWRATNRDFLAEHARILRRLAEKTRRSVPIPLTGSNEKGDLPGSRNIELDR